MPKIGVTRHAWLSAMALAAVAGPAHPSTEPKPASKYVVLHTFAGGSDDGASPAGGVTRDSSGNLYGTTYSGGSNGCAYAAGCGTVFKIDPSGTETILYRFSGGSDGANPNGGLILDANGNMYGTTGFGGNNADCSYFNGFGYYGCGVVFKLDQAGNETVLYTFEGAKDGGWPVHVKLLADTAGNLYGAAGIGGDLNCSPTSGLGCGVAFRLGPNGNYTVLHRFRGNTNDGYFPGYGVVEDARGDLFGSANYGGVDDQGAIFEVTENGAEKVLHGFTGGADGGYPAGQFAIDADGQLYGTASQGGNLSACGGVGCGVVFRMTSRGKEKVLYDFRNGLNGSTDGRFPHEGVVIDSGGNIYGTTYAGGTADYGTVFELTKSTSGKYKESILYNFTDGADGASPTGGNLILDPRGNLYGVAQYGGASCTQQSNGCGVVFKLKP